MSEKMTSQNNLNEIKLVPYNKPLNEFLRYVKSTFTPRCTTLFHIYLYFLTYRLYNIYSYFFILSFNGFLRCESPSPKLISAFFVATWRTPFTLLLSLYRAQLWSIFRSQTKERLFPFVYWFPVLYISWVVPAFPTISRKAKVAQTEEIHCVYWFPEKYVGRIVPAFPTI